MVHGVEQYKTPINPNYLMKYFKADQSNY